MPAHEPQPASIDLHLGDPPVVVVAGEIDLSNAAEFRLVVEQAVEDHDRLVIDLRETSFMDSTGLAVLLAAHRRLGRKREALVIRDPAPIVSKLLDVSGFGQLVDIRTGGRPDGR